MCRGWKKSDIKNSVFLFNSAFRGTYSDSLFKIMSSQGGLHVVMRYALARNVPQELRDEKGFDRLLNQPCIIVFVNRYNKKAYEFVPLRKGTINKITRESGYLFIVVKLNDFIWIKDNDIDVFTSQLLEKLKEKNIPQLQDSDPKNPNDGNYIVESDAIIENSIVSNSDSWVLAAEYLCKTKALDEKFTFIKIEICKSNKKNSYLIPDIDGFIIIAPNCKYILNATYFDPTLGEGKFYFTLGFQSPLSGMQNKINCTSRLNNVQIPISSGKNVSLGYKSSSIGISQVENDIERSVLTIPCKVEPISKDVYAIILVIIIFTLAVLTEWEHSTIWFSIFGALKWLFSLIFIAYAGMRIF
jgi:hypothetical protein